ncbi:MAG: HU family DNA-binding protein [Gammaproteobacteria bacterium]|nr:HU family DNA-binding protein [Gammaproteobacteria bacterium]
MNKAELVDAVVSATGLNKPDVSKSVDAVFSTITSTLAKSETVAIVGFGNFTTSDRAARTGRNPRTGETINIAASRVPKFKAGKALKDAVSSSMSGA